MDPVKVTRSALQNAASIASMILSTKSLIAEKKEKSKGGGGRSHDYGSSSPQPTDEGWGRNLS